MKRVQLMAISQRIFKAVTKCMNLFSVQNANKLHGTMGNLYDSRCQSSHLRLSSEQELAKHNHPARQPTILSRDAR